MPALREAAGAREPDNFYYDGEKIQNGGWGCYGKADAEITWSSRMYWMRQ
jgi:hypothetical protein